MQKAELVAKLVEASGGNYNSTQELESLCSKAARVISGDSNIPLVQDIFTLREGVCTLTWPRSLSAESADLFEEWMALRVKILKRAAPSAP